MKSMIGKRVTITDRASWYYGHWGYIQAFDGDVYHISGGSFGADTVPVFDRQQFKIERK